MTITRLITYQLHNPRPLNSILAVTVSRIHLLANGPQYTSDLIKVFTQKYKFNHVTSSPYWAQSNGRAEAAVKSAKRVILTADDVDLALLSFRNTPPAGHTYSPAQRLF